MAGIPRPRAALASGVDAMPLALPVRAAIVLGLLLAAGRSSSAQLVPLDDVWFRLGVRASGFAVDPGTLAMRKAGVGTKAFLRLRLGKLGPGGAPPNGVLYDFEVWTRQDGGRGEPPQWALSDSGQHQFIGPAAGDQLAVDLPLSLLLTNGRFVDGRGVFRVELRLDQQGSLRRARLRTLGGETIDGSTDGQNVLAGRLVLAGKAIPANKLPFEPD
jgi:hypothetical protein